MDDKISLGHPFYFPTQVVLIDDDPDFLEGVSLMLEKDQSYRLFKSASEGLDYVNQAHQQVNFLQRCYSNYKTGPLDTDSLSHVDIGKLHEEIFNNNRFQTCATVIVDYSMPEMNGLEFLMALKNPFIKKVLLTGQADMELAIKAFNKQLIDQFIDKHDPRLNRALNTAIKAFQEQYFQNSYKLLTDPIIANNHDSFLTNTFFQKFFFDLRQKTECVEYYLIDFPHSGFLMVDARGKRRCLLIFNDDFLAEHIQLLKEHGAPEKLISEVSRGKSLPAFDDSTDILDSYPKILENWEQYYHPGIKIGSTNGYFATILTEENIPACFNRKIIPYSDFIAGNVLDSEIIH